MSSQATTLSYRGSRSRSRSASQSRARSQSIAARRPMLRRVPRGIRLNGEYKMTRVCHVQLTFNDTGVSVGGVFRPGIGLIFNPASVTFVGATAGPVQQAIIPNYTEMSALWERVRIDKVVMQVTQLRTDAVMGTLGLTSTPIMYSAFDNTGVYDNTLAITQQQSGCKSWHGTGNGPDFIQSVVPEYQRIIYYTALLSSYEPAKGYVVSDTEIPHYGIRLAIDNNFIGTGIFNFRFTYHYSFRDVK